MKKSFVLIPLFLFLSLFFFSSCAGCRRGRNDGRVERFGVGVGGTTREQAPAGKGVIFQKRTRTKFTHTHTQARVYSQIKQKSKEMGKCEKCMSSLAFFFSFQLLENPRGFLEKSFFSFSLSLLFLSSLAFYLLGVDRYPSSFFFFQGGGFGNKERIK